VTARGFFTTAIKKLNRRAMRSGESTYSQYLVTPELLLLLFKFFMIFVVFVPRSWHVTGE
jgi:hypothetical protein